jgi:MFS family permease
MDGRGARYFLAFAVLSHLAVTLLHGFAHTAAHVPTTLAASVFIYLVIEAGPLAGLWVARSHPRAGGWIVASTMAGSLVFGLVNHFVIGSPDHVNHVAEQWRMLFASTAVLLVITEGIGTAAGAWLATRVERLRPHRAGSFTGQVGQVDQVGRESDRRDGQRNR